MTIRSATNKRAQNREYAGAGRKSAASAKPARAAASSVRVVPSSAKARRKEFERGESLEGLSREEKRARKQAARAREDRLYTASNILLRQDSEYRGYRRVFWILLGAAIALTIMVWVLLFGVDSSALEYAGIVQIVGMVAAYALVIGAFIFDFVKVRPLRNYYRAQAEGMTEKRLIEVIENDANKTKDEIDASSKTKVTAVEDDAKSAASPVKKSGRKKDHRSRR